MPLLDDLLARLPLGNPAFHSLVYSLWTGGRRNRRDEERHQELLRKLEAVADPSLPATIAPRTPDLAVRPTAPTWDGGMGAAREVIVAAAGDLKEALRFAREPRPPVPGQDRAEASAEIGLDHPQARMRLDDAAATVTDLERYTLAPERLRGLPAQERTAIEALLPDIRRLRQALHDASTDLTHRYSTSELEELAADAGTLATRARVAAALATPARSIAAVPPSGSTPQSLYALDADFDTGCLPCGIGHWAAVDTGLRAAAEAAGRSGAVDPAVQARLTTVEEELEMMTRWDWTPERVARTPPADRAILEVYAPAARDLYERVRGVHDTGQLEALATMAHRLKTDFADAIKARPQPGRPAIPHPAAMSGFGGGGRA